MNTNILIIGNGFDLYHDLPTKYIDFYHLQKTGRVFIQHIKMASIITSKA